MNLLSKLGILIVSTAIFVFSSAPFVVAENTNSIQNIKNDIESTQEEIKKKQIEQQNIASQLKKSKEVLEKQQKELTALNGKHKEAWIKLQDLRKELEVLSTQIKEKQAQLSQLLFTQNKRPSQDALVLLLKNENPNQKGRDLTYLRYIALANKQVVTELKQQQELLAVNEQEINQQLQEIDKVIAQKQSLVNALKGKNTQALNEHDKIMSSINIETQKLVKLRNSERELARLTKRSANINRPKKTTSQGIRNPETRQKTPVVKEPETVTQNNMASISSDFSKAKGRLLMPTGGSVTGRFGMAQPEGGAWKGIFISTSGNQGVRSVFEGTVLHTGQVGSFGNTVIIDHGENYVSVYMGLSSVNVSVGSQVKTGQSIGVTGQDEDGNKGLYFQIRYQSQPVNPASWLS